MDFTQSMDNGYMIPTSVAVGSGEATDIRCVCDTVEDFKTFLDTTDMELRYEGLVTYEKVNKLLKVYKGNNEWQVVGEGGESVDTSSFITLTQLSQQLSNYYTKNQTDNKISEEIAKAQLGGDNEVNFVAGVKEWNCLGDSITDGFGVKEQYHKILKDKYNIPIVNNYGISSSEIAVGGSGGNPMCVRYKDMSPTADLITVFGGVNDLLHNIPLGCFGDNEDTTFYGALNILCKGLIEKFKNSTIIFFTPIKHSYIGVTGITSSGWNSLGLKLEDYINAIKEVCNYYSIPIIDINNNCGMNFNIDFHRKTYSKDGLHPNANGHLRIARAIEQKYSFMEYTDDNITADKTYGDIVVSSSSLLINENSNGVFSVSLSSQPSDNQVVTVSVNNDYCTIDKTSLTFTPNNYSVAQAVTVSGVYDSSYSDKSSVITLSSPSVSNKNISVFIKNIDELPSETIPVESVSLDKDSYVLKVGETVQLIENVLPSNATNKAVAWSCSNSNASVVNGLVTGVLEGDCEITVTTVDGNKSSSCKLTIEPRSATTDKIYLYNLGDQCESITGGYATSMITFNSSDFKIAHSPMGIIKTTNTFTLNTGDKVCAKVIACDGVSDAYEVRLMTDSTIENSANIATIKAEIESNGAYLFEFIYTKEKVGQLAIGNYFGNYTISEWYIEKA